MSIFALALFLGNSEAKAQNPTVIAGPILSINYQITNNRTPTVTGVINSPSASVYTIISRNKYKGVNNGDGSWAAGINNPLDDGSYDVTAVASEDWVQIMTTIKDGLVIDTVAPKITINNLATNDSSPAIQGTTDDDGAMIMVNVEGVNYDMVNNNGDNTWTLPAGVISPKLSPGVYKITAAATDLAGNASDIVEAELFIMENKKDNLPWLSSK